jgi:hypothetical protein
LELTCSEPPGEVTHWTGRAMAKAAGISLRAVQRLWKAHRLQPHRIRTFKRSNDPNFAEKVEDVVGLYMDPPAHAVVVSIDEKSQIQALDRTQPGLPLKPGKCGTMTHDRASSGPRAGSHHVHRSAQSSFVPAPAVPGRHGFVSDLGDCLAGPSSPAQSQGSNDIARRRDGHR